MKITLCIGLLAAASLTGCSELSSRQRTAYQDYSISAPLAAKIQAHRPLNRDDIVEMSHDQVRSSDIMAYMAYSHTDIPLTDDEARDLSREKVNADVITYLRERPNDTGGLLSVFSSWSLD